MCHWKTKVVAMMMAFVLFFSVSAGSAYAVSQDDARFSKAPSIGLVNSFVYVGYMNYFANHPAKTADSQDYGWKSALVKEACEFIAWLLRKGVSNDTVMKKVTKEFDKVAADELKRYAYKIANELEYIGQIPDVTTQVVKEKLINFMRYTLKINGGTAQVIGEGIAAGIDFLIF